jgi:hypothetical protein
MFFAIRLPRFAIALDVLASCPGIELPRNTLPSKPH